MVSEVKKSIKLAANNYFCLSSVCEPYSSF